MVIKIKNININFFHTYFFYKITSESGYFRADIIDLNSHYHFIVGLSSGNFLTKRTFFYNLPSNLIINEDGILQLLLEKVKSKFRKSVYIDIRFQSFIDFNDSAFIKNGFTKKCWYNIIIDTINIDEVKKHIKEEKLRQINKSLKQGAKIKVAENTEEVHQFYQILRQLYRKKIKKPLPAWSFFKAFFEICSQSDSGMFLLIEFENRIVGGMMCPIDPGEQLYEWYIAGLDKEMQIKGIYPSVLVTWGALEYACSHNLPKFNFMGAGEPSVPYGVRDFKLRFGGELVNTARYIKVNKPILYIFGKVGIGLMRYFANRDKKY